VAAPNEAPSRSKRRKSGRTSKKDLLEDESEEAPRRAQSSGATSSPASSSAAPWSSSSSTSNPVPGSSSSDGAIAAAADSESLAKEEWDALLAGATVAGVYDHTLRRPLPNERHKTFLLTWNELKQKNSALMDLPESREETLRRVVEGVARAAAAHESENAGAGRAPDRVCVFFERGTAKGRRHSHIVVD
jgi:hypothetical protein